MDLDVAHVLLVGGDETSSSAIADILRASSRVSVELHHASCVEDALHSVRRGKLDLVIVDTTAPDVDEVEALRGFAAAGWGEDLVVLADDPGTGPTLDGASRRFAKASLGTDFFRWALDTAIERMRARREVDTLRLRLQEAQTHMGRLSLTDPLTGLLNRAGLQDALSQEFEMAMRRDHTLVALLIDIDDFERINERLGHGVGDVVLRETVVRIGECVRPTDHVGRVGGDLFLVILPTTPYSEGRAIAERIRLALADTPVQMASGPLRVTASIGLVTINRSTASLDELLSQASGVLRRSKRSGKNQVAFEPPLTETIEHDDNPLAAAFDALAQGDRYHVVRQGLVDLKDESIVGYELLARLAVPGFESPGVFFRLGFEANILTMVDHGCFKSCLSKTSELPSELEYHVNLMPSTLLDIPTEELLTAFPEDRDKSRYCVEISEQQIIGAPSYLVKPIRKFREAGVRIAIDDVGFGRSCLENLVVLHPEVVKIDRKCISGVDGDPDKRNTLERIYRVATALGSEVVAEGIERREELAVIKELGIPYAQGFLWGRPS